MDSSNKKQKLIGKVRVITLKNSIEVVLMNTKNKIIEMKQAVKNQRLKLKQYQIIVIDDDCEIIDDKGKFQSDNDQQGPENLGKMLIKCQKEYEQIEKDSKTFERIIVDYFQKGLNQYKELQQRQQLDFIDLKKSLDDKVDLYYNGKFSKKILNQIYAKFYNLSLEPCAICQDQPEIQDIKMVICGHAFCGCCLEQLVKYEQFQNNLKRCPICRKYIQQLEIDLEID